MRSSELLLSPFFLRLGTPSNHLKKILSQHRKRMSQSPGKILAFLNQYEYRLKSSFEDKVFVAECLELRLKVFASNQAAALSRIKEAGKKHLITMLQEQEELIPLPNCQVKYFIDGYNYCVGFSATESIFVAHCQELGVTGFGGTQEVAISNVKEEASLYISWLFHQDKEIPAPST